MDEQLNGIANAVVIEKSEHKVMIAAVTLILILYTVFGIKRLSPRVLEFMNNMWTRLILLLIIAYVTQLSPMVGVMLAIAVLALMIAATNYKVNNLIMTMVHKENMEQINRLNGSEEAAQQMQELQQVQQPVIMQEQTAPSIHIAESDLSEIQAGQMPDNLPTPGCGVKMRFRDKFYPQYQHEDLGNYAERGYEGGVTGYDSDEQYAAV